MLNTNLQRQDSIFSNSFISNNSYLQLRHKKTEFKDSVSALFPAEGGALAVGVPTAISSPMHEKMGVQDGSDVFVWPSLHGSKRGQVIKPFYPELAEAALKDPEFYGLMSAIEILRVGRARERNLAVNYLEKKIKRA